MKKLAISLSIVFIIFSCKGPKSGPLVKGEYYSEEKAIGMDKTAAGSKVKAVKANVSVQPCEGCIKIADLLSGKKEFEGKTIKIKGSVTKFNPEIMGKNWVHIQDGTEFEGVFDLTVTTGKKVSVGDILTFEGKIVLNKDFGYGYFYPVLMEEAQPGN